MVSEIQIERSLSAKDKLLLAIGISVVVLIWTVIRSAATGGAPELDVEAQVDLSNRLLIMGLLAMPIVWVVTFRSYYALCWLLGFSVTTGVMPDVPLMPYVIDYGDLVFFCMALVGAAKLFSDHKVMRSLKFGESPPAKVFTGFFVICIVSLVTNMMYGSSVWQIKVGISQLITYGSFLATTMVLLQATERERKVATIVDGMFWATIVQLFIAAIGIVLVLSDPLTEGSDVAHGLAYWDRLKGTFSGPDQAGIFFVVSIPLTLLYLGQQRDRLARIVAKVYLQIAPWLMIATGSRTAKGALVVAMAALLMSRATRAKALPILLSVTVALSIGWKYQSMKMVALAVQSIITHPSPETEKVLKGLSLEGRFFKDKERARLIRESLKFFSHAPWVNKLVGVGPGVEGHTTSGFPSAHMDILSVLIDTGLAGLAALSIFILSILRGLWTNSRNLRFAGSETSFLLLVMLVAASIACTTWVIRTWGYVMIIYVMAMLACSTAYIRPNPNLEQ